MDELATYLPMDRRQAWAHGMTLPERAVGAVLCVEVDGYAALAQNAEALHERRTQVFQALNAAVDDYGGSLTSWSGDGMVAWFNDPLDEAAPSELRAAMRATACALVCQRAVQALAGAEKLSLVASVASGAVQRWVVGAEDQLCFDLIVGAPRVRAAVAAQFGAGTALVVDAATFRLLDGQAQVADWVTEEGWDAGADPLATAGGAQNEGALYARLTGLTAEVAPMAWPDWEAGSLSAAQMHGWHPAELDADEEGLAKGALRTLALVLVRFTGLDWEAEDARGRCDAYVRWAQGVAARQGGTLINVVWDDAGTRVCVAVGTWREYGDSARRAVALARDLCVVPDDLAFITEAQVAVSLGELWCGVLAGATRRAYCVAGAELTLLARLVQMAEQGAVLATGALRERAGAEHTWQALAPLRVKGRAEPVAIYALAGTAARRAAQRRAALRRGRRPTAPFIGRAAERGRAAAALQAFVLDGTACTILIDGASGSGKTRLAEALCQGAQEHGARAITGTSDKQWAHTPYALWRPVVAELGVLEAEMTVEAMRAALSAALPAEYAAQAPLLGDIFGWEWPESAATRGLTGRARAQATRALIVAWLQALVESEPLVLVLDNLQWCDTASWALIQAVQSAVTRCALVLLMPTEGVGRSEYAALIEAPHSVHVSLEAQAADELVTLVARQLGVTSLPEAVATWLEKQAAGSPLMSELLAAWLRDMQWLEIVPGNAPGVLGTCRLAAGADLVTTALPNHALGIAAARIDRLAPTQQVALKIASVLGERFAVEALRVLYPTNKEALGEILAQLEAQGFIVLAALEPALVYQFKHTILRETAYNATPFAQRRALHAAIAEQQAGGPAAMRGAYWGELAYHWAQVVEIQADDLDGLQHAVEASEKAGEQALRVGAYVEAAAVFGRALGYEKRAWALAPGERAARGLRRGRWLCAQADALAGLGQAQEARARYSEALTALGYSMAEGGLAWAGEVLSEGLQQVVRRRGWLKITPAGKAGAARLREVVRAYQGLLAGQDVLAAPRAWGALALKLVNVAELCEPSVALAEGYAALGLAMQAIGQDAWAQTYRELARTTAGRGPATEAGGVLAGLALGLYHAGLGAWEPARAALEAARTLGERVGQARWLGDVLVVQAQVALFCGDFQLGAECGAAVLALGTAHAYAPHCAWGQILQATSAWRRGDAGEAMRLAEAGLAALGAQTGEPARWLGEAVLAQVDWQAGRAEQALTRATTLVRVLGNTRPASALMYEAYAAPAALYLARWAQTPGEEPARVRAWQACKALTHFAVLYPAGAARAGLWQGEYERLAGRPRRAEAEWATALTQATQAGMPYEKGLILLQMARYGAAEQRADYLADASTLFDEVGAMAELSQVETLQAE